MAKDTMGEIPILKTSIVNDLDLTLRRYTAIGLRAGATTLPVGTQEVNSLTINAPVGAAGAGNVTITLDGTPFNVAVANNDTAIQVADKIRIAAFAGWTAGGVVGTNNVTFTSTTVGLKVDGAYAPGATGAAGVMTTPTQGQVVPHIPGILQNSPSPGETASVMVEGYSFIVYGGALASGDEVTFDALGRGILRTNAATQQRIGIAQVAGVALDIQAIKLG